MAVWLHPPSRVGQASTQRAACHNHGSLRESSIRQLLRDDPVTRKNQPLVARRGERRGVRRPGLGVQALERLSIIDALSLQPVDTHRQYRGASGRKRGNGILGVECRA